MFRRHGDAYIRAREGHLGRVEKRVISAITACRTAALGGHIEICEGCEATRIAYNSCRNRHCPKCQGSARATWLAARQAELLPVPYFHIVFTLPQPIAAIAYQNKKIIYAILFRAAAEAMTTLAANPRRLGAGLAASPFCTRGVRRSPITRICTASFPAVELHPTNCIRQVALDPDPFGILPTRQAARPPVPASVPGEADGSVQRGLFGLLRGSRLPF